LRLKKDGGELDGITGATITSRAVIDGLRQAAENFRK
jgi:Na+-translocating ferredoxin:NAD+ oxidoreductase RnfG subunit